MKTQQAMKSPCVYEDEKLGLWLYQTDCFELMDTLMEQNPQGKFDMIFADPPYFLSNGGLSCHAGRQVSVNKGAWDVSGGMEDNHRYHLEWLGKCQKLLNPNGTIWVSGTLHSIHSVGYAMQQLKMKLLNDIAWEKPNPPPNLSCRYFTHSAETILWAAKNKHAKHTFNYQAMKQENAQKQMKTVWNIKPPTKSEKKFGKHPTQKPLKLLTRIIQASTQIGDLIFDPFAGSSTTGVAAIQLNRQFIGCELEDAFIHTSCERLKEATLGLGLGLGLGCQQVSASCVSGSRTLQTNQAEHPTR